MGFLTCFSLPTPTSWVFLLTFFLPRPLFSPQPIDKLPGWVFSLAFLFLGCHHIAFALWYIVGRILNMCFAHMRPPTPTPWVSPPTFLLTRPSQYIRHKKLWIFCDKIMYPIYETTHICYIKHNSFIEFKRIVFHTENLFYNSDFHPSTQTTFYRVSWRFHMFSY